MADAVQRRAGIVIVIDSPIGVPSDISPGAYLEHFDMENIVAAYHLELLMIFDSVLSRRGIIDSVYVNFPGAGAGWFRILPRFVTNFHDVTPGRLKQLLTDLFATGYILDPPTNQQIWSRVNIQDVFDNFPRNTRIVGCLSGEVANNFVHYDEYIASHIQHDHSYVFVVGIFAGGIIERFIHENVKVSNYSLRTYNCISNIISGLQKKWNIW